MVGIVLGIGYSIISISVKRIFDFIEFLFGGGNR